MDEIHGELKVRGYEFGINRFCDLLKERMGKEIQGKQEEVRGKPWVYWVEDSSLFTGIRDADRSERTEKPSTLHSNLCQEESSHEQRPECSQGDDDSSRSLKEGSREELRNPTDSSFTTTSLSLRDVKS